MLIKNLPRKLAVKEIAVHHPRDRKGGVSFHEYMTFKKQWHLGLLLVWRRHLIRNLFCVSTQREPALLPHHLTLELSDAEWIFCARQRYFLALSRNEPYATSMSDRVSVPKNQRWSEQQLLTEEPIRSFVRQSFPVPSTVNAHPLSRFRQALGVRNEWYQNVWENFLSSFNKQRRSQMARNQRLHRSFPGKQQHEEPAEAEGHAPAVIDSDVRLLRLGSFAELGSFLKECRDSLGYRLQDLEERLGVDASTISRIEAGQRIPGKQLASAMAELYRISANKLLFIIRRLKHTNPKTAKTAFQEYIQFTRDLKTDLECGRISIEMAEELVSECKELVYLASQFRSKPPTEGGSEDATYDEALSNVPE